jgi:hypothetical protein
VSVGHPGSPHPGGLYSHTAFVCDEEQQNGIFLQGATEVMLPLSPDLGIPKMSMYFVCHLQINFATAAC